MSTDIAPYYEYLIEENLDKGFRVYLVVSEFREVEYIHVRKYFLSYEGTWVPSREGVGIPLSLTNIKNMLEALLGILSASEGTEPVQQYLQEVLDERLSRQGG